MKIKSYTVLAAVCTTLLLSLPLSQAQTYTLPIQRWNDYVFSNREALADIESHVSNLKETVTYICPIGIGNAPLSRSLYKRSFMYLSDIVARARGAFGVSYNKIMETEPAPGPFGEIGAEVPTQRAIAERRKYDWEQLDSPEDMLDVFRSLHEFTRDTAVKAMVIERALGEIPGWVMGPNPERDEVLDALARAIDFVDGGEDDEVVVNVGGRTRERFIKRLGTMMELFEISADTIRKVKNLAKMQYMEAGLNDLIRVNDPNHGEGEEPFTLADLFQKMEEWFGCWVPDIQGLQYWIMNGLEPVPKPMPGQDMLEEMVEDDVQGIEIEDDAERWDDG